MNIKNCAEIATGQEYIEKTTIIRYKFKVDDMTKKQEQNPGKAK